MRQWRSQGWRSGCADDDGVKILHGNVDDRELQLAFFLEGAGFVAVWMPVLILVTFGVGSFAAAWLKFRKM